MNYDQHVAASFQTGFEQRLQQMVAKSAMTKVAGGLAPMWRRLGQSVSQTVPRLRPRTFPMQATAERYFRQGGSTRAIDAVVRGGQAFRNPSAIASRGGMANNLIRETPVAAQPARKAQPAAGKLIRETPVAQQTIRGPAAGAPPPPGTPPPPPGASTTPPPGAAPGTITPEAARQMGLVTTNRGFTGGPRAPIDVEATVSGADPTGGLLGRIRSMLPGGARAWSERNPEAFGGALGALGGGGAMMAGDQYGDWRRRRAIENLGLMDRLGLAFQLAASPRGFNQTLGL